MQSRDDSFSVLNLGWKTSRQAWRLLAGQEATFMPEAHGSAGRDMDQLAYDLHRLGHEKPARLAYSVAFILNGFASQTIQFDHDLADKALQIVVILAEMLLELAATSQITIQEPIEIVDQIRHRWGLVLYEDHSSETLSRPHFRHAADGTKPPAAEANAGLLAISEELVWVSQSLLKRVLDEGQFPYTAALSRIHHLGTTIRDRVVSFPMSQRMTERTLISQADTLPLADVAPPITLDSLDAMVIDDTSLPIEVATGTIPVERCADCPSQVLIIDASPFFRMLLTTAIEAAGYSARAVGSLAEAQSTCDADRWNVVICDELELVDRSDASHTWLRDRVGTWNANVVALANNHQEQTNASLGGQHRIRRTDIRGLLNLIKLILGPGSEAVRMSA